MELLLAFTLCILIVIYSKYLSHRYGYFFFVSPFFLFAAPQAILLIIMYIFNVTEFLETTYRFTLMSGLYLLTICIAYFVGSFLMHLNTRVVTKNTRLLISDKNQKYFISFGIITLAFGTFATVRLLSNISIGYFSAFSIFLDEFNLFDRSFFSNSYAILWRINFAALFFAALIEKRLFRYFIFVVAFTNIVFRAAFLYIPMAIFYYGIPRVLSSYSIRRIFIFGGLFLLTLVIIFTTLNYGEINGTILERIRVTAIRLTPYSFGNFVNFNIYFSNMESNETGSYQLETILFGLGTNDLLALVNKYLNFGYKQSFVAPFYSQIVGYNRYGNTFSYYGSMTLVPYPVALIFTFFLGALNAYAFNQSFKSIFFVSIYSWFSVANFFSFAGGGHFSVTRFFPAVFYIWPLLLLLKMLNRTRLQT